MAQPVTQSFPDHSKSVLDQLNNQRYCGAFCDILLQIDDYDFKLHKCLLAALSAKLQTMLFNMRPECGGILTLRDISVTGFRYIIEYLYTGTLHLNTLHVHDVLAASQYLEIREIEKACYDFLKTTVSTSSHAAAGGGLTGSGLPDPVGRYTGYHVSAPYNAQSSYQAPQSNVPSSILNYNYKEDYMKLIESLQVDPSPSDQPQQQPTVITNNNVSVTPAPPPSASTTITETFNQVSVPTSTLSEVQPQKIVSVVNSTPTEQRDRDQPQLNDSEVMRTIFSIFSEETFPGRDGNGNKNQPSAYNNNNSSSSDSQPVNNVKSQISAMLTPVGEKPTTLQQKLSMPYQGQIHTAVPLLMETVRRDLTSAMHSVCDEQNAQVPLPVQSAPPLGQHVNKKVLPLPSISSMQKLPQLTNLAPMLPITSMSSQQSVASPQMLAPPTPLASTSMASEEGKDIMSMYNSDSDESETGSNRAHDDEDDDDEEDEEDDDETDEYENEAGSILCSNDNNTVDSQPLMIQLDAEIIYDNQRQIAIETDVTSKCESAITGKREYDNGSSLLLENQKKRNKPMHIKKRIKLEAEALRQKEREEQVRLTEENSNDDQDGRKRKAVAAAALASLSQSAKITNIKTKQSRSQSTSPRSSVVRANQHGTNGTRQYQKKFMTCEKCGRKFFNKDQYLKHMDLHKRELLYSCHVCGLKYARREDFTRHMRSHSNETFTCTFCNNLYTDAKKFKAHMRTAHHDRKPFCCQHPGCTFRSDRPSYVEEHAVIHSDIKTHTCEKCGKQFSQRNGLRIHKQSCYEQRSYLCDICGAKFNQLQSMKSHRRLHTGEKPHICCDCGKAFTDHTNYKRHRRIHENSFPYPCDFCEKRYRHSNSLKAHMKSHKDKALDIRGTVGGTDITISITKESPSDLKDKDNWDSSMTSSACTS